MLREMAGDMLHISRYAHMKFLQDPHVQARDSSCAAARRASETLAAAIIELSAKTPHGLVHIWSISGPYQETGSILVSHSCHAMPCRGCVEPSTQRRGEEEMAAQRVHTAAAFMPTCMHADAVTPTRDLLACLLLQCVAFAVLVNCVLRRLA